MNKPLRFTLVALICLLLLGQTALAANGYPDDWKIDPEARADYPQWFLDSFLDLQDDLANARDQGKKGLMVVFSMPYCSHCKQFASKTLRDDQVVEKLTADFDAVHVDLFSDVNMVSPTGESMSVKAFGKREKADFTPAVFFYDLEGKRMLRLIGYQSPERFMTVLSYLSEGHNQRLSLKQYISKQTQAKTVITRIDDPLFSKPPYHFDRRSTPAKRQLMVIFDEADCQECNHVLGELFQDPIIRPQLERLDLVRLNLNEQTPVVRADGSRSTAKDWYAELGFNRSPAFVFFDEHGNQVMTTDAMMLHARLNNTLGYVLERAYEEGIRYQRFASRRAGERKAAAKPVAKPME
ncbi:MAG: thioredoxin fold domain-containing protein [Gammaproteobacteria bacterium]